MYDISLLTGSTWRAQPDLGELEVGWEVEVEERHRDS